MPVNDHGADIELLIRSRYSLIVLDTIELEQAEAIVKSIAARLSLHYYRWTRSKGLLRGAGAGDPKIDETLEPARALSIAEREGAGIFLFRGLGPFLDDPLIASHVQDVILGFGTKRGALVITGHDIRIPDSLRPYATTVRIPAPAFEEYRALLERVIREHSAKMPVKIELSQQDRVRLINNLQGLTLVEAEKVLTRLIIEDGALRENDVSRVVTAKRQAVEQDGLLEYHHTQEAMKDVAGMKGLKTWLAKRRSVIVDPYKAEQFGLSYPKGVLLLGVPGCGKSLCAKAVACEWGLPLLKLDPANLYDKYVGNSEKNFKQAMSTAERMAPIVLWIDELEKAFGGGGGGDEDGGVSRRVFGTFLSWLQDRKGDVFVVATSNDVAKLPPEFIRKGRFDEVFFVDLPREDARKAIFEIHLGKRKQNPASFDLPGLVRATEGFSGAEIEQAIISGLYTAFDTGTTLTTKLLLDEISITRPLSQTMSERLGDLRDWARDRTVAAD